MSGVLDTAHVWNTFVVRGSLALAPHHEGVRLEDCLLEAVR
jgi:hypothetical protein